MEKALKFLLAHKNVAFATVEGNKPKIRTFEVMKQENDVLYFATAPDKEVYAQLQQNPAVELLAMEGNISVRIAGQAIFDVPDQTGKEIYRDNPVLQRLYGEYTDLVYFRLPIAEMDYYDLTPTPPVLEHREVEAINV